MVVLVLLLVVGLVVGLHYMNKGVRHGVSHALYHNTNARALEEVWTTLTYTAPGTPAELQRAVVAKLGLTGPPTAFVARTYVAAETQGRLQLGFGNKMQSQFTGVATFVVAPAGGTAGTWEVARWTTHDGVIESKAVIDAMVSLRTGIADAVQAAGGSATVRVVPQVDRKRR